MMTAGSCGRGSSGQSRRYKPLPVIPWETNMRRLHHEGADLPFRSTLASPIIRRHFIQFAVAAAVAAVLSGLMQIPSANATLLNFDFSFTNTTGNVDGTVTGVIFGLTDNAVSTASRIIITSAPDQLQFLGAGPFPITVMPEPGFKHSFTVDGGRVVAADLNAEFFSTADGGGEAFIALIDNIPGPFFTCQVGGEHDEAYDYLAGCTTG